MLKELKENNEVKINITPVFVQDANVSIHKDSFRLVCILKLSVVKEINYFPIL